MKPSLVGTMTPMPEPETAHASPDPDSFDAALDVATVVPRGRPCEACGAPVETGDRFCTACGCPVPTPPESPAPLTPAPVGEEFEPPPKQDGQQKQTEEKRQPQRFFRCKNCGSEVASDPDQRSYVCAFCDSTYVVEFAPEETGRQSPEFIIGFSITRDDAHQRFRRWIQQNSWFRPGDLRRAQIEDKLQGVYLPFWSFSMLADSRWSARIGEYWYRTETYWTTDSKGKRVQRTRTVRETEWWPLQGRHHRYYSGFLVSGSRGLAQADAERIKPFQLPALKRYEPFYLAGWLSEEYSLPREDALATCQHTFRERERANVGRFMPGDTHRNLQVSTDFHHVNSDLCLLPVYVLSYRYRETLYRFLVNGQTGKVAGDKPVSTWRVAVVVGIGVLVAAIVALVIWLSNS